MMSSRNVVSPSMTCTQYVIDTGPTHTPLKAAANKYVPTARTRYTNDSGYILIFLHGTGFLKELWEPIIERLLAKDAATGARRDPASKILECWAIDCQTHGESAALNDETLSKHPGLLNIYHYSDAVAQLYQSGLLGISDHTKQRIIVIGHSAGSVAAVLTTMAFGPHLNHPIDKLVLIEPGMFTEESIKKMTRMYHQVKAINPKRRAVWASEAEARKFFEDSLPYNMWDQRSRNLYIEHGLRALPTPFQKEQHGVTLACKPMDEAAAFGTQHHGIDALNQVTKISAKTPIHFIFGARNDMFSREVQDVMYDAHAGRKAASVVRIKGAGHLVVQEKPDALADAIFGITNGVSAKL